jgi:hypothetical protein
MTAYPDLERRVTDLFADEAPQRAPDWLLTGALATIEITSQRRVLIRMPRRIQDMNSYAKLAIAAVAVVAVGVVGLSFLGVGQGPSVGASSPSPSPSLSTPPSPSTVPNPSLPPPLTETFTSAMYGISISYPTGWSTQPATEVSPGWEGGFLSPGGDWIYEPSQADHLFIVVTSEALAGAAGEAWADDYMSDPEEGCGTVPTEPITVDGEDGLVCDNLALVWVSDRGYNIRLYTSDDDAWVGEMYDPAWFRTVLDTVQLAPEDAVDPSASASP